MSNELRPKEIECWKLKHQGKSVEDIGCALGLAYSSVRTYLNSAKRKIDADPSLDPLKTSKTKTKKSSAIEELKTKVEKAFGKSSSSTEKQTSATSKKSSRKPKELWTQDELNAIRRASSPAALKEILKGIKVRGKNLEERVQEYKLIRCAVCPHGPYDTSRCSSRCADPILAEKYLY